MYEKEEDEGNVGFQFKMAREIFRGRSQKVGMNRPHPINNPIIKPLIHTKIEEGAKEFSGHEDVVRKFLG